MEKNLIKKMFKKTYHKVSQMREEKEKGVDRSAAKPKDPERLQQKVL